MLPSILGPDLVLDTALVDGPSNRCQVTVARASGIWTGWLALESARITPRPPATRVRSSNVAPGFRRDHVVLQFKNKSTATVCIFGTCDCWVQQRSTGSGLGDMDNTGFAKANHM